MATAQTRSAADLQIVQVPIDELRPDPANPRKISAEELDALTRSLKEFGFIQPVLARHDDHIVLGGHQRLTAARRLGIKVVPVIYVDVTEEQGKLLNLALNRISGEWDDQLLARMLADLKLAPEIDLSLSGFTDDELTRYLKKLASEERREQVETFDLDAALEEARAHAVTKTGDIWLLCDHRLLCGDATVATDVTRLLDGRHADLAFTDPPYNVAYDGGFLKRKKIENDSLSPEAWEAFCRAWGTNLVASVDGALYVCMSTREWPTVSRILEEADARWSDTIIWQKDRFTVGRADYQRGYEPVWYGWREGSKHQWLAGRDQNDVWLVRRPSQSPLHPTMKPLELIERALENSSRVGDRVLDLFLGSGSTMIAAERLGRVCLGVERDPIYVDVAVRRWENFTGQKATRQETAA